MFSLGNHEWFEGSGEVFLEWCGGGFFGPIPAGEGAGLFVVVIGRDQNAVADPLGILDDLRIGDIE